MRREDIRNLQARIRDLEASRASWKEKAKIASEQAQTKDKVLDGLQDELSALKERQAILEQKCEEYKKKLKR